MKEFSHPFFDEIYYYKTLNSTNKKAEQLIRTETANGNFLVICDQQTGGIGRNDNYWFSPPGGIWMTAALYALPFKSGFTLFSGLCILKALEDYITEELNLPEPDELQIKWPNDIFWGDRKICGLLSNYQENYKYHIIGIGLNSNNTIPDQINSIAVSLKEILGQELDNQNLIKRIFNRFSQDLPVFLEKGLDLKFYLQRSYLLNRRILLDTDFDKYTGEVQGINKNGALLLKLDSGMIQPFYAGSVELIES